MRALVAAVGLCLAACTVSSQPAAHQTTAALQGDLPVFKYGVHDAQGNPQWVGGFLHLPGGSFQPDRRAGMVLDGARDRIFPLLRTAVQPYLFGSSDGSWGETTYDQAAGRWLPVARAQMSGDGLRYAYRELRSAPNATGDQPPVGLSLHVVDVRSGSDRVVYGDSGKPGFHIVGLVKQDIFVAGCGESGCWGALSRVDITTGKLIKVSDRQGRWVISGQVAWVAACSPATGPQRCDGPTPGPDQIVRVDLTNGSEQVWDQQSGIDLVALDDGGMPLVRSNSPGRSVLVRMAAPGQAMPVSSVAIAEPGTGGGFAPPSVADGHSTWLYVSDEGKSPGQSPPGPAQGLYLYAAATGMQKVSDFAGVPVGPLR